MSKPTTGQQFYSSACEALKLHANERGAQKIVAARAGTRQSTLSHVISGRRTASLDLVADWVEAFNVAATGSQLLLQVGPAGRSVFVVEREGGVEDAS